MAERKCKVWEGGGETRATLKYQTWGMPLLETQEIVHEVKYS